MPRYSNRRSITSSTAYQPASFTPAGFEAAVFTPQSPNLSYLQKSLDTLDLRKERTDQQMAAINAALSKVVLNAAEDEWKTNYINNINAQVDNAAQFGDYSAALETATRLAGEAVTNPALIGRERANKAFEEYKKLIENRTDLNQVTKDRWLATNPYHYEDKYDANGNVVGSTAWSPDWNPVSRYDMTKLYGLAQQLAAKEAGGGESASFLDENGNITSDPSKGFYGMAVKRGSKWERLSEQKLKNVFNALFAQAPEAMDSLLQDMDDRKWQYDNATDEGKKAFIGSDIIKDDGTFRSPKEYLSYRVNPILSEMAYNHVWSSVDYGGAYAARAKAMQDTKIRERLLGAQQLENNATMTIPLEIDMKDRAGRSYGSVNNAMSSINRLFEGTGLQNTKTYKELVNNSDYKGLANFLTRYRGFFVRDPKKINEFNANIRLLREEGDNFKAVVDGLSPDEQKAVKTYFSIQSGVVPSDAANNEYTRELASLKNNLFSYSNPNGSRTNTDSFVLQFDDNSYMNNFLSNLGISSNDLKKHSITSTTYQGKPAIIVNKDTDILTDIANANSKLQKRGWLSAEPSKVYNISDDGRYIGTGVLGAASAAKLNALSRQAPSMIRLESQVDNIFKRKGLNSIEPLQVKPYDDYNTLMLNKMWTSGMLEDATYKEIKKEFEDNNLREVGFAMQHPNNYTFYGAVEENGNAVKLSQKEVSSRVDNLLRALDNGLVDIAPSDAPTGKGYGTIIRVKGKLGTAGNKEVKQDILYVDGLFDGPASQAIARSPETLYNHGFKTARAMKVQTKAIDGTNIDYSSPNALGEYIASKMLDEVYNELDINKAEGKTLTQSNAEALANSLIQQAGYDINSDYASSVRAKLVSTLLNY